MELRKRASGTRKEGLSAMREVTYINGIPHTLDVTGRWEPDQQSLEAYYEEKEGLSEMKGTTHAMNDWLELTNSSIRLQQEALDLIIGCSDFIKAYPNDYASYTFEHMRRQYLYRYFAYTEGRRY